MYKETDEGNLVYSDSIEDAIAGWVYHHAMKPTAVAGEYSYPSDGRDPVEVERVANRVKASKKYPGKFFVFYAY